MLSYATINDIRINIEEGTRPPPQMIGSTPLYFGRNQYDSPEPRVKPSTPATAIIRPNMKKTLQYNEKQCKDYPVYYFR